MNRDGQGNLPAELTPFVGREDVLADVAQRLTDGARLITLTGPGGVGKTRLAIKTGRHAEERHGFLHGVWMVSLAGLNEPGLVDRAVAAALGVIDNTHGESGLARLVEALRDRNLLLIVDNCEHLLPAVRQLARAVLQGCPDITVLATSQEQLRLHGEHIVRVPPMKLGEQPTDVEDTTGSLAEAVRLFLDRAHAVGAEIDEDSYPDSVRLCAALDGLPLAIELAAVRLGELTPAEILEQLNDDSRFSLLVDGDPVGKGEHQTLLRTLRWSAALCSSDEQRLWARLSVFPEDFDRESVEAVCTGDGIEPDTVLDLITGLVRKSILVADASEVTRRGRYRMLDSIRLFGRQMLADDDRGRLRERHADHYLRRVKRCAGDWLSPREVKWMRVLNEEWPNIRSALTYYLTHEDQAQVVRGAELAVCCSRSRFAIFSGMLGQHRHTLEQVHRALAETAHPILLDVTAHRAWLSLIQGEIEVASALLERARATADKLGVREESGPLRFVEGTYNLFAERDLTQAARSFDELTRAADITRQAGLTDDASMMDLFAAISACFFSDSATANRAVNDLVAAAELYRAEWTLSWALWTRALFMLLHNEDLEKAYRTAQRALARQRQMGDRWGPTWALLVLACIAAALDRYSLAARLLGGAHARQQAVQVTVAGLRPLARIQEHAQSKAKKELGAVEFDAERAIGMGMPFGRMIDLALEPLPENRRPADASASGPARAQLRGGLSPREFEIAGLVAEGKRSKQIASLLTVSPRTVDRHLENIRSKLGLRRRAALAEWFHDHSSSAKERDRAG